MSTYRSAWMQRWWSWLGRGNTNENLQPMFPQKPSKIKQGRYYQRGDICLSTEEGCCCGFICSGGGLASCHLVFQYSQHSQCGVFFALIVPALTPVSLALACVLAEQIVKHTICLLGIHHAYLLGVLKYLKVQEECCYFCKDLGRPWNQSNFCDRSRDSVPLNCRKIHNSAWNKRDLISLVGSALTPEDSKVMYNKVYGDLHWRGWGVSERTCSTIHKL